MWSQAECHQTQAEITKVSRITVWVSYSLIYKAQNVEIFPCENTIHLLDILALRGQGSLFRSRINLTQQESWSKDEWNVVFNTSTFFLQ